MIRMMQYSALNAGQIFARQEDTADVSGVVRDIIRTVRTQGDKAVFAYNEKFDGCKLSALEVTPEEIEALKKAEEAAKALKKTVNV